jgi:hypothetical protein
MTWRDSAHPSYSAEYHRQYPLATACNGTGLINRTTTTITIKAMFIPAGLMASMSMLSKETLAAIGEIQKDDVVMFGAVNTATGAIYNLSNLNELQDKITFQSRDYVVRHYFDSWFDDLVGQVGVLKRIA